MGGRGLISFCFRSLCAATRPSRRQAVPGAPWPGSTPGSEDAVRTEPPARMGRRREPGLGRTPRRPSGSGVHRGSRGQSQCGRGRLATQPQRPRDANPSGDAASHFSAEPRRQGPRRCRRRAGRGREGRPPGGRTSAPSVAASSSRETILTIYLSQARK